MIKKHQNAAPLLDNDVDNLFFQTGMFFGVANYSEFVRERAARNAASRWPLLVEVYDLDILTIAKDE